ncbi:MAG: ATP-binding protein [Thermoplasmata archaeon]
MINNMLKNIPDNYVKRELEDRIWKYIDKPEIISITGPRQSGKTTMLLKIHEDLDYSNFISFEDREILDLFEENIKDFSKLYFEEYDYLIIDEFQYAEEGGQKLKYLYDHHPDKKIVITGSSITDMTVKGLKHLTGRILNFELYPFNFEEFIRSRDENLYELFKEKSGNLKDCIDSGKEFDVSSNVISRLEELRKEYTIYGGYPRVVLADDDEEKRTIIKNIINTYLLREIRDVLEISEDRKIRKLMKLLSLQIGELTKYSKISDRSQFKYKDLKDKLNILEYTFVMKRIDPFFTNKQKEIVKTPKVYFFDNGLRNGLINNFQKIEDRSDRGELNENFFFSQAIHHTDVLKYWRSKSKSEVDFIFDETHITPVEVKTTPKITRSLRSFCDKYDADRCFIVNESGLERNEEDVIYLPLAFSGPLSEHLSEG